MQVKVTCLGCQFFHPIEGHPEIFRTLHRYLLEAVNGLIEISEEWDSAPLKDGVYELPDSDWEIKDE